MLDKRRSKLDRDRGELLIRTKDGLGDCRSNNHPSDVSRKIITSWVETMPAKTHCWLKMHNSALI